MLVTSKDAIRIKVIHDRAVNYMFEEFTCDACKRDRTLVSKVAFVKKFLKGRDNREFSLVWDDAWVKAVQKEYRENVN